MSRPKDKRLDYRVRELVKALNTLSAHQGQRARRNARLRVGARMRALKSVVDGLFPAPLPKAADRTHLTPQQRTREMEKAGWKVVASMELLSRITAAGIKVRRVKVVSDSVRGAHDTYAPAWAIQVAASAPGKLGKARRDLGERKAIMTELALGAQSKAP